MPNYCEGFGVGPRENSSQQSEFCFTGASIPGHASDTSNTNKSIPELPFHLVETSTGQSFQSIVIKLYLEVLELCLCVLLSKSL